MSGVRIPLFLVLFSLALLAALVHAGAGADSGDVVVSIELEINSSTGLATDSSNASDAQDQNEQCQEWASAGECQKNPGFMLEQCAAACKSATTLKATAFVYDGEDAGVGAFRFAEDYLADAESSAQTDTVLKVAAQLQEALANNKQEYTPPQELTHCSAGAKMRPCSAGKLWKRAEEMRKADMHDAAGADLIRALIKTGTEVDFVERCKRSLQWALGSIQRQREREKREAIEEAKLEQRREEERVAMEEAARRKEEYEADFVKFGTQLQQSVDGVDGTGRGATGSASVGADGTVETEADDELSISIIRSFVEAGPQGGNWNETLQLIKKVKDKSVEVLLIEARCHEILGNHKSALSAAGRLISKAADYDPWINDSPRMMAATLGANAAMQLGLSENALSFYQTVLKFDPEQARARKQYRGLKKVVKLMDKAEQEVRFLDRALDLVIYFGFVSPTTETTGLLLCFSLRPLYTADLVLVT